mgnify:CR=1 FL=1
MERNSCNVTTVRNKYEKSNDLSLFNCAVYRKLVVPGDLRSYGGGNGLPRGVKQSPDFSRIMEEDEEQAEEEDEQQEDENEYEEKKADVSMILVSKFMIHS